MTTKNTPTMAVWGPMAQAATRGKCERNPWARGGTGLEAETGLEDSEGRRKGFMPADATFYSLRGRLRRVLVEPGRRGPPERGRTVVI